MIARFNQSGIRQEKVDRRRPSCLETGAAAWIVVRGTRAESGTLFLEKHFA